MRTYDGRDPAAISGQPKARRVVFFDFCPSLDGKAGDDWLQITAVNDIGSIDKEPKQKIIRLDVAQQEQLLAILRHKLELSGGSDANPV